ncbi:transcription-repair coupling factor [Intestinimonas massiliensis]|uniref:Transcription-repair-coupling factor n=1 Tax=Intestinimonas massiliensis (ex Afouda et al. 2020) TaxID=1673721 RepID=A0ABS9M5Q7_9FIRM|nr:transcription-repair coupling factor [Intestinimonas massiliensis (ex Afouda et al. 2020)]MCG4526003.1 transcription-repair coupling factor [Intestinimonas massiliensis (ex Afouda et al. 2020)]MCQ4805485.1 transcription-repair coupling factor [Intestinimonas massiliensis (ex Afouda et al. 2020)]
MKLLTQILSGVPEFPRLLAALDSGGCPAAVSGLSAVHRAHFAAGIWEQTGRPVVLLCADETEADRLAEDLTAFTGQAVRRLSARDFTFHNAAVVSRQWEHRRLSALRALAAGESPLTVCTVESLLQRTLPRTLLTQCAQMLRVGESHDLPELAERLSAAGYTRCEQVEGVGQFALRGGILDVFSPAFDRPVRAEFFGDEIDSMGLFDVSSQRRTVNLREAEILPASEVLPQFAPGGFPGLLEALDGLIARVEKSKPSHPALLATLNEDRERFQAGVAFPAVDRYLALIYPQMATAADYLPEDAVVLFCESPRVAERAKHYLWRLEEDVKTLLEGGQISGELAVYARTMEELCRVLGDYPVCFLDTFTSSSYPLRPRVMLDVMAKQLPSYGASLETAAGDLRHYQGAGFGAVVLAGGEQRCLNLQSLLREEKVRSAVDFALHDLPGPGQAVLCVGGLSAGFEYPDAKLAVLTEGRPAAPRRPRPKKQTNRQKLDSYADLSPGDLVVHEHHGIGRYVGMVKMTADGVQKDYVKINYAGADVLYVPATQLDLVSKYIGAGENVEAKKLSKLGGADWEKAKTRAKKAVADLAKGLIQLYAERQRLPGYAFSPDSPWQKEFEDQFEYTETDDQLRCIAEIKRDMEKATPMDRLLCGDVGYGKTEVAFRAIMKCMLDGKQAAILAPTTVLARQHYLTAKRRFAKFPVEIDVVSRFRTAGQMRATLQKLQAGKLDLLIGTHRLFQKDVKFKDLGLLVVDEEQRFGVAHKEKLKELSKQVDVLTLSATPIPRTLNMALSGIRDMSTLEEPPQDRLPVQTYVLEHDWGVLADAMKRELERGGQVYYLHNRVETIERTAARIQALLPEARIGVGHGKMTQEELSDVMSHMTDGDLDILVCTTIIETGIDIPNANTLIIEDADHLGLAQLHQIRGRVGRSARRASAYMTYRRGKVLTEVAAKRLGAIREFAEFGSGFKIAMRDLEIRGAGNVLGPEQSGFLLSVGYDMYLKLLEEAVLEERGEKPELRAECAADLTVAASIPDRYVPSPEQRMDLYRRIARIRSEEEADDLVDELVDRYGDPPRPVNNLISVALLRAAAAKCGITEIAQRGERLNFTLRDPDLARVSAIAGRPAYRGRLLFSAGDKPYLSLKVKKGEDPVKLSSKLIEEYGAAAP